VIAAGFAATFAESISMGAVAYTSTLAEHDHYRAELERGLEGYDAGHRYLLEARATEPNLAGILGPLTDSLEPAAGYERAIEALLGARLQALCVAEPEAAGPILDLLAAAARGRATLVAARAAWNGAAAWPEAVASALRDRVRALPDDVRPRVRGPAGDLVTPARHAELVGRLLGDGVVVEDLGAALALAPHLPPPFAIATSNAGSSNVPTSSVVPP